MGPGLDGDQGLSHPVSNYLHRRPRLQLSLLLSGPVGWLVIAYLGSLAVLFVAAFWTLDPFTSGETTQSSHMYMQFGCFAWDEIIHVSDQPVAPSLGSVTSTGTLSAWSRLAITCQVVPITLSPPVKAACSFV